MDNLKDIKKQIRESWLDNFSELKAYNQSSFYKIVGCTVIGFNLIRLPLGIEEYRPYFVCYQLSDKDVKECMSAPLILKPLVYDYSGNYLNIPYKKHFEYMDTTMEFIKKQISISFTGDINLNQFLELINDEIENKKQYALIFEELSLYTLKIDIALYVNNVQLFNESLTDIENMIKRYPIEWFNTSFKAKYGTFNCWFTELKNKINNRDIFLSQLDKNKQDSKLKKLYVSEIII